MANIGGGGYVFAEIPYAGVEIGVEGLATSDSALIVNQKAYVYAGVYGKFPFFLMPGLSIFPKLGVNVALHFNEFYAITDIVAGVGVDYNFDTLLGFGLFVRAEALLDALIEQEVIGRYDLEFGTRIRLAVGYRF
jgi:hypothetical protein